MSNLKRTIYLMFLLYRDLHLYTWSDLLWFSFFQKYLKNSPQKTYKLGLNIRICNDISRHCHLSPFQSNFQPKPHRRVLRWSRLSLVSVRIPTCRNQDKYSSNFLWFIPFPWKINKSNLSQLITFFLLVKFVREYWYKWKITPKYFNSSSELYVY